ncbi:hypothetical protein PSEUDO9AZ_20519 [Pseudomonas sp. 9AZ]|nr:hypothetical protein PSEUDO9AZ_20519 [Pseudomonas sp. 9AZ]
MLILTCGFRRVARRFKSGLLLALTQSAHISRHKNQAISKAIL